MIVKNEAPVIRRCLDSVRPLIDYWIIVDTGSTDDTQNIIRESLEDLPGELVERPWVDFSRNRSEALEYARGWGDYVFVIDADETLEIVQDFEMPQLTADSYNVEVHYGGYVYLRKQLVRNSLPWCYQGVVHEYISCDEARTEQFLSGLRTVPHHDGARAQDPLTYRHDALLLENALLDEPNNTRYVFYLAQSYRDAGDLELAVKFYKRRVAMGGWSEEVWFSLYQIAQIRENLGEPWAEVMQDYLVAYQFKPDRANPLYRIAAHYQCKGEYHTAHLFFSRAMQMPYPTHDCLFIEQNIYNYLLPVDYAVSCYYTGDHAEAIKTNNQLLRQKVLPAEVIDRVIKNRRFSLNALFPQKKQEASLGNIYVCIVQSKPESAIDNCIESLIHQKLVSFKVVLIEDGFCEDDANNHFCYQDDRFSRLRYDSPLGFEASVEQFATQFCQADDILIPLRAWDRFPTPTTLFLWCDLFNDPTCQLAYGQFRQPSGHLGNAEPACNEADFQCRGAALASQSPIAFRVRLLLQSSQLSEGHGDSPANESLWQRLFAAADFSGARFTDTVITFLDESWTSITAPTVLDWCSAAPTKKHRPAALASVSPLPLISCLMVTHDRLALAKRAIRCFANQTYPAKELVIVTDGEKYYQRALKRYVGELSLLDSVRFIHRTGSSNTLGHLRNVALDSAFGDILCQWDDDDCFHPDRLYLQAEHLLKQGAQACFFTDHLHYLEEEKMLAWVDWTLGGRSGREQLLPGTVMLFKDDRFRYPEIGQYSQQGEDTIFLYSLYDSVPVIPFTGMGYLYLYTYHGRNTFSKEHHYRLSQFSPTAVELHQRAEKIRQAVTHYPIQKPVVVVGRDRPAFALN